MGASQEYDKETIRIFMEMPPFYDERGHGQMEDIRGFVSMADLHYQGIDRIAEAGIPIGNGRMGSLVWMDKEELHMQFNRVDVFANDASSQSFPEMDTDYANGVGAVDIFFGSGEDAVFSERTMQDLSVYDGRLTVCADGVSLEVFMDMDRDICFFHLKDERDASQKIRISLRTLRGGSMYLAGKRPQIHPALQKGEISTYYKTGDHLVVSCLKRGENSVSLRQTFEEKQYFCQSVLEVRSFGRKGNTRIRNQWEAVWECEAKKGEFWLAVATAQSFGREKICSGLDQFSPDMTEMEKIKSDAEKWWHDFWDRAPKMKLHSADKNADLVGQSSVYFLYLMAATSRGSYMPRYGGLLFYTAGDYRYWGAQYWWHNQSCYYAPLVKLGCYELADTCFHHILNSMESYKKAARQQWGTSGIFIPETCWFSGPCEIPEELQEELQALYTLKKPWEEKSEAFLEFAWGRNTFESRWNWKDPETEDGTRGYGAYSYVNHIFSTTAKIAMLFWERYLESGDEEWLTQKGYPVLRGTAMMYRDLPFYEEGEDGYLHIRNVNNHEELWNACDTISELAGIHGILPIAVKAAEILGCDEKLREEWREFEKRVVPILTNESKDALFKRENGDEKMWCCGTESARMIGGGFYHNMDPVNIYHLLTMETEDGEMREIGENTYRKCLSLHGYGGEAFQIGELDPFILTPGKLGDKKAVADFVPKVIRDVNPENFIDRQGTANTVILDNRMTLREGVQAIGAQRLGQAAESMACALCNAVPGKPAGEVVLHLFEGLPDHWDAEIELPGGNGYQVKAKKENGEIKYLFLETKREKELLIRNPWGEAEVTVDYGNRADTVSGKKFKVVGSCRIYRKE